MTTFTAIALDPGGTTGWAYYRATKMIDPFGEMEDGLNDGTPEWYDVEWQQGQLEGSDHADDLLALLERNHTTEYHVICERFQPRPNNDRQIKGANLEIAQRYQTVAEMFARDREVPFILQLPSQGKGFVKDTNIKKLGLWHPGWRHAMDAQRHLLFWLVNGPYKRVDLLRKGWKF